MSKKIKPIPAPNTVAASSLTAAASVASFLLGAAFTMAHYQPALARERWAVQQYRWIDRAEVAFSNKEKMDLINQLHRADIEKEDLRHKLSLIEQEFFTLLPNLSDAESRQAIEQIRQHYLRKMPDVDS